MEYFYALCIKDLIGANSHTPYKKGTVYKMSYKYMKCFNLLFGECSEHLQWLEDNKLEILLLLKDHKPIVELTLEEEK